MSPLNATSLAERNDESKFRAIFDSTLDGILIADDFGRYIDANPAACNLMGMRRERIIGRAIEDFSDPQRRDETRKTWRLFLERGNQMGFFRIYRPDGSTRHVEYIAKANVLPHQHLSILRDITERNQAELSLRTSEDRLHLTITGVRFYNGRFRGNFDEAGQ
jgi:PAS domain S-box-containing protein